MTHMDSVGVRELRQSLSRYLARVKSGESLTVTERGQEIAVLAPMHGRPDAIRRLVTEHGATPAHGDLLAHGPPVQGDGSSSTPMSDALEVEREERLD